MQRNGQHLYIMNPNNYQLICSDIDGTLLDKNRELSPKTIMVFKKLKEQFPLILISSRMPKSLKKLQEELQIEEHPLIAYNGSLILAENKIVFSQELPFTILEQLSEYVAQTSIHLSLYHRDEWVVPQNDYWAKREAHNTKITPEILPLKETLNQWKKRKISAHKVMCMGAEKEIEVLYQKLQLHKDEINAYRSKSTYIEVSHIEQDKASALSLLLDQKYPETKMNNVVAFGDNYNDSTLIEKAGLGIAVSNAKEEVLKVANEVCPSNIDDGVALFLDQLFLT